MDKRDFKDKVVVVTGAAGGIGAALAQRFAEAGANVGLLDRDEAGVSFRQKELKKKGVDCLAVPVDITDETACREAIGRIRRRFQRIDLLVNNAGIPQRSAFVETSADVYRQVMDVNFFGSLYCTQAVVDDLIRRQGMIIVISSVAGFAPLYGRTAYAASKHALHGLFGSLRTELNDQGVDTLIVCPSFVNTDFGFRALDGDGSVTKHPQSTVGKIITPEMAADKIYTAACRRRRTLVLSPAGKASWWLSKLLPSLYEYLMARSLKSELDRESP